MKHHFGDFLDREGDYWTIVPNNRRYVYEASDDIEDKEAVRTITISKQHEKWQQVFECPNLEELTLHDPRKEQVREIQKLTQIKRLRVTFFRAADLLRSCITLRNSCWNMSQVFRIYRRYPD